MRMWNITAPFQQIPSVSAIAPCIFLFISILLLIHERKLTLPTSTQIFFLLIITNNEFTLHISLLDIKIHKLQYSPS